MVVLGPEAAWEAAFRTVSEERVDVVGELKVPLRVASTAALVDASASVRVGYADVRARRRRLAMRVNRMVNCWWSLKCKPLLTP